MEKAANDVRKPTKKLAVKRRSKRSESDLAPAADGIWQLKSDALKVNVRHVKYENAELQQRVKELDERLKNAGSAAAEQRQKNSQLKSSLVI